MQKNVAGQKIGVQMVSATDGSAFTGSVTVYVTGDAGTQAIGSVGSGVCTHEGNGYHTYAPAQAETNYDLIAFTFTGTGAVPVTLQVYTRYDANVTAMQANVVTASALATDAVTEIQSGLATAAALTIVDDFLDTEIAAIKAKTDNLPTDPADASDIAGAFGTVNSTLATIAGYIDTEVAAIKAKTDNLPADPADASDIAASFAALNTKVDTIDDFLDTEIAAIKAKTDNLPSDPADQSAVEAAITAATSPLATAAALATVDTVVDTILADTNELQTDWANGGRLDLLLNQALAAAVLARQILGNKHTVVNNGNGTYTITVRDDSDTTTVRTIIYTPATGARTAS